MTWSGDTKKIDSEAVLGLLGTSDSLAYKVHEIEKHFHNRASWWGDAGSNRMMNLGDGANIITPWTVQANATPGTYGTVVTIDTGVATTPILTKFPTCIKTDLHSILITDTNAGNASTNFLLQFGTSFGTWDDTTILTEVAVSFYATTDRSGKIEMVCPRLDSSSGIYCRVKSNVANKNISFILGIHCYVR